MNFGIKYLEFRVILLKSLILLHNITNIKYFSENYSVKNFDFISYLTIAL